MEWFKDLYDEFRMKTGFGSVTEEATKKEVDFIIDVLALAKDDHVLDLFCGAGRHTIELSKRGYITTGIEYNQDYLTLAKKHTEQFQFVPNFIQGDVRYVEFGTGYDGVIIMFNSFGFFSDKEEILVLRKIHSALKMNGRLLLEIQNRDWIIKNFTEGKQSEIDGIQVIERRQFDILNSRNNFTIERYEKDKVIIRKGSWRMYSAHELKKMLEEIGFKLIAAYDNLEKQQLSLNSRLMRLIFEKERA